MIKYLAIISFCLCTAVEGGLVVNGLSLVNADSIPSMSPDEHYAQGVKAAEAGNCEEAIRHFGIVKDNFSNSDNFHESIYQYAIACYYQGEFEFANNSFTEYLKCQSHPKHFDEVMEWKLAVADQFRCGATRRFFGTKQLPMWASGRNMAYQIYDEIITSIPCHELAAKALYCKAAMQWEDKNFRGCIDSYHSFIRRFPKHEWTPDCYLLISCVYLEQCQIEFQNPDLLALAQISCKRFCQSFPKDERTEQAQNNVMAIKEVYANGLYETGQFYERTSHPKASIIYYKSAITQFPDTLIADQCRERLYCLGVTCEPAADSCESQAS